MPLFTNLDLLSRSRGMIDFYIHDKDPGLKTCRPGPGGETPNLARFWADHWQIYTKAKNHPAKAPSSTGKWMGVEAMVNF